MEEKKEKKKLNKKPLLICLAIALVFALIGIVDINVNAAENEVYSAEISAGQRRYKTDGTSDWYNTYGGTYTLTSSEPMYAYWGNTYDVPTNARNQRGFWCVISKGVIEGYAESSNSVYVDGETWYIVGFFGDWGLSDIGNTKFVEIYGSGLSIKRTTNMEYWSSVNKLIADHMSGNLDVVIDYDTLPIDYSMPIPTNVKRNIISEDFFEPSSNTWYVGKSYEYIVWENTSDLKLQIQTLPVVQYFKLYAKQESFVQQFHGNEWNDSQILDGGTNKYTIQTDINYLKDNSKDDYDFYNLCLEQKELGFHEQPFFFYAYQIRYVDEDGEKAGPWLCIYPNEIFNGTNIFSVDENGELSNTESNMGEVVEKPTGESTLDETLKDIDNTLEFKDKYDVVDGDVDTQEAANWLYSVVNFIKGTPQVVGSVLGFLPQPILYGMYVTIFLGVIASGLAIIKALF